MFKSLFLSGNDLKKENFKDSNKLNKTIAFAKKVTSLKFWIKINTT